MSDQAITDFRDRVITEIRTKIPELRSVDWYDGLFDEDDIEEWVVDVPCCYVGVRQTSWRRHTTGELNGTLDIVAVVITEDKDAPRDADAQLWTLLQKILVVAADSSRFADPNAGDASNFKSERIKDPVLRRQGIAFGVAEWSSPLTIGTNWNKKSWFYFDPQTGAEITDTPANVVVDSTIMKLGQSETETVDLTEDIASVALET